MTRDRVETEPQLTDTLTESFCERCGTRYEFSAPTRLNPLRKTRGLIGGLKNYLTSQDALSDAVGDALRGEQGALATAQLDAFHEAFNFCIDCRQYTCLNCWNNDAGRCRSCAPIAGTDDLAERVSAPATAAPAGMIAEATMTDDDIQRRLAGEEQWPTSDLPTVAATQGHVAEPQPVAQEITPQFAPASPAGYVGADGFVYETPEQANAVASQLAARPEPEPEPVALEAEAQPTWAAAELEANALAAEIVLEVEPAAEPVAAEAEPVAAEAEPVAAEAEPVAAEDEAVAAEAEPQLPPLRVVAWDEDAALDLEPEPIVAEVEPEPIVAEVEPEPIVAEVEPESVVAEVEPESVVAEVEPESVVAEVEPESVVAEVEPEAEPVGTTAQIWPEPEQLVAEIQPEPEPAVAEEEPVAAEAEAEPPAPESIERPHIAPISETILPFPQRPTPPSEAPEPLAAADESPEVAARRAQLDLLGLGGAETPEVPPAVLPYRSRGAAVTQAEMDARAAGATFWEASAREVAGAVGNVGLQNCGECGLSLSANARFCRRCGTRQARSA